jgi:hypothetical protein
MKPIWPVYEDYEPLTAEESRELIRLVRKATGAGCGCGVLFRHFTPGYEPQAWFWQDSFIRFGSELQRAHQHRAAAIGQHNPANVREVEWGAFRTEQEKSAKQKVAEAIARGE